MNNESVSKIRTRRQKVEDREAAIILAARELFNSKGYAKTTVADIAAQSGVADGTLYTYFKNKDALAHGVLASFYDNLTVTAQSGVDALSMPAERIRFLAEHHLTRVIENWRLLEMLPLINLPMEVYGGSEIYQMNKAYVAVFDRAAKDAVSAGLIRKDVQPWVLRDNFYGSLEYGARTIIIKGNKASDADVFIDNFMQLILGMNANTQGGEGIESRLEKAAQRIERAAASLGS